MTDVTLSDKTTRSRCEDEKFLEAVFSSKTYAEIALKTGQKVASTMARYTRTKKALAAQGIDLPAMERAKPVKRVNKNENMADIVHKLREAHNG